MDEKPVTLKSLKKGSYIIIDGEPCKVISTTLSKPGKHGSAKCRIEAIGIFDNKKRSLLKPADSMVSTPIILKKSGQVVSITGNIAQVMDLEDYSMFETNVPDELKGKLEAGSEVEYWRFGNRVLIKRLK